MTQTYMKNISPDSLTGMIFAMEGIKRSVVMLNGPMGCKFYHSATAEFLSVHPIPMLPPDENGKSIPANASFMNSWFFRQYRVPCTYLDGYDYVYGSAEKLKEGLIYLKKSLDFDLLVIVNSPGASLIGDNLREIADALLKDTTVVTLESPGYSESFSAGYSRACLEMCRQLKDRMHAEPEKKAGIKSINLLGLSIWQRYGEGDKKELIRLFEACGIRVNACPCLGSSLEEILRLPQADLNVVIYPEYGRELAGYLKATYGTPVYICDGPPIGFAATEKMLDQVCDCLGLSPAPALKEELYRARALSYVKIRDYYNASGLPKGVSFAIEGEASRLYAYSRFFMEYLGMLPECLQLEKSASDSEDAFFMEKIEKLLIDFGLEGRVKAHILESRAELVFANGNTIAQLSCQGKLFCGIEIAFPGLGYTDILPKTHLGILGGLFLTEQVLNGVMSKL